MTNQGAGNRSSGGGSGGGKIMDLPLVPESVLKRRHDLDDMARRRAAERAALGLSSTSTSKSKMAHTKSGSASNNKKTMYVKKPETILASAISRRNHRKRYQRVLRKGMQKRAKNVPDYATKTLDDEEEVVDNEDASTAPTVTKKYQTNSVGASMVLVVRIRDDLSAPRPVLDILQNWGLDQVRTAVFVKYSDANRKQLHLVEPWVVYGPPTSALVQDLLERRGHGGRRIQQEHQQEKDDDSNNNKRRRTTGRKKIQIEQGGERIPLSDNTVIETALGNSCNLVCKEDLVHEICSVGQHFDAVTSWLWPFQLEDSKTKFERTTLKLKDGRSDYGDRGDAIVEYVQNVL